LAESYGVSVKRLRQLGVVGEINYQPFDAGGRIVDRPELRVLMHRILSVEGGRLQTLSRRPDRHVVAVAGGRAKLGAVRGAAAGCQPRGAPPIGSGTIASMTPRRRRSGAVIRIAAAASGAFAASPQRIAAHPSGEITE